LIIAGSCADPAAAALLTAQIGSQVAAAFLPLKVVRLHWQLR
jgi:hypothetical protein